MDSKITDHIYAMLDSYADQHELVRESDTEAVFGFVVDDTNYSLMVNVTP